MNQTVRILSDSTCDLSPELIERYQIRIIPLHIVLGEKEYEDSINITPDDIYRWSDENKETPKTSAPSMEEATEAIAAAAKEADKLVIFSISFSMSISGNVFKMAAEELGLSDRVFVVDSMNLSTGIGHLVIEAAEMAQQGMRAEEIIARIEELRPRVRASFVVDKLTFLHRGGRCSGVAAMAGTVLSLHPKIVVENGAMHPDKKYRGKLNRAVSDYVHDMEDQLKKAKPDRVFITHSGCDRELIDSLYAYLESLGRFKEILITRAGGVISSHCGPGTLGVLFIEGE